jgi:hypothetical protein
MTFPDVAEAAGQSAPAPAIILPDAPLWLQNAAYGATVDRSLIDALWSIPGIVRPGDLLVAPRAAGANMSVDVAAGRAVVTGTDAPDQGKYLARSLAPANLVVAAAPGAGTSRIDLVVLHVYDAALVGGTDNLAALEVVAGTAAATPVAPALPPSSLLLAQLTIPAALAAIVAGNIADRRPGAATPALPRGIVASGTAGSWANAAVMNLSTVVGGAAGWLAGNTITVPAGAGGLYAIGFQISSTGAAVMYGAELRNAANATMGMPLLMISTAPNQPVYLAGSWLRQLADGATVRAVWTANPPTSARVVELSLHRVGDALAAA